ncbi:LOW QUALITY PROTEIN: interleukin-36 gamma-like [Trichechus inunguis]
MVDPKKKNASDLNHQVWVLQSQNIVAVPWSDNVVPVIVTVTLIPCKYPESFEKDRVSYLGIKNPEMCLSCEDVGGQPTLKLKVEKILDLYNQAAPVNHNKKGKTSTFVSAAVPGWFIASSEIGQPIFLTSELGKTYNTEFDLAIEA